MNAYYPSYDYDPDECSCGRGDGCDCDGIAEKNRADEYEASSTLMNTWTRYYFDGINAGLTATSAKIRADEKYAANNS